MFVANVTYYFEIFSWNLKKMRGRGEIYSGTVNPEKPYVPLNKNDAFQKVQKRRVQEKR